MPFEIYNTLTRQKEQFVPLDPTHVRLYLCGPTVYDYAHVGNARPVVVFDVLARLLRHLYPAPGAKVTYVRNITDVDDKIIEAARTSGEPIAVVTARMTDAYHEDVAALGALPPDLEPRATQHIAPMIAMIGRLIASGHAYVAADHVLFHVPSMPDYGRLSRRNRDDLIAGARVEVAPYKRDPADFVLWKPSPVDMPGWASPWGRGRPGWHIECSAMAETHLGVTFDIHGGGLDLIFPHHENEIAQSSCAHDGAPLARYWVHNGFLTIDGEKMAKSLGNFTTVRDLLAAFPGEAIRLELLSAHYRQPLGFGQDGVRRAKAVLDRWYGALRGVDGGAAPSAEMALPVLAALEDDLNTPLAISHLHELAGALNKTRDAGERAKAARTLRAAAAFLGLLLQDPEAWFRWQPEGASTLSAEQIEHLIADRQAARKSRNYAESDRIRSLLAAEGVQLEDGPHGTTWKRSA